MLRVKVIITDGDSQETSQLDIVINLNFPNDILRVRCSRHVVDRGWARCYPGVCSVAKGSENEFKAIIRQIKAWFYSWMQPHCESEEEYKISKALLTAYLQSPGFLQIATKPVAECIQIFIHENDEPLESFICFYNRRAIQHYNTYTNSSHEGTNNRLKTAAAPVIPQHSLDSSASILNQNAEIKSKYNDIQCATAVLSQNLWSPLPTANHLTHKGEGLVTEQWNL